MASIRQQIYTRVQTDPVLQALEFAWYGSDAADSSFLPPPGNAALPFGYIRWAGEFQAGPADTRAVVQFRLHDHERRQYTRINAALARLAVLFPRRPDFQLWDPATTELWWFPETGGWGPELEDPDRPSVVLRVGEWVFRKVLGVAAVAASG
jgi:hypothetical protein